MKRFIYFFIFTIMFVVSANAQVFQKLPDDFFNYESTEAYDKAQEEALIAAAIEEEQLNRLKDAFHDNDLTSFFNHDKSVTERTNKAGYGDIYEEIHLVLFSSKPYDEGYILKYEYFIYKETDEVLEDDVYVYRLDVKRKKCESLKCYHEDDEYLNDLLENKEMIEVCY